MRREMRQVAADGDRHGMLLLRRQVIEMQRAELFVHQCARSGADGLEIQAVIRE